MDDLGLEAAEVVAYTERALQCVVTCYSGLLSLQVTVKSLRCVIAGVLFLAGVGGPQTVRGDLQEQQHVLVVVGAPGSSEYASVFRAWAERWRAAAKSADAEFQAIGLEDSPSDKDELTQQIDAWSNMTSTEPLWIILIGHGTYDGRAAHFNLRGPDITASETAVLLKDTRRPVALINCASCSAPFINAISGPNRVIVTATKNGSQHQLARFGDAMSSAVIGTDGDLNEDGQVSLLEAWAFAAQRTHEYYAADGRLATEHALLDDNGDQRGSRLSGFEGVNLEPVGDTEKSDGSLARNWCLVRSEEERRLTPAQRERRNELEASLEVVRRGRGSQPESEYLDQLASVLVPLAQLYREIDAEAADESPAPPEQPSSGD